MEDTTMVMEDATETQAAKPTSPAARYKWELDSMVQNHSIFVQTFVKKKNDPKLGEVYETDDWPDESLIEAVYQLSFRPNGSTQFFSEKPYGLENRRVQYTHYFDDANRTIAFEKYVIYDASSCSSSTVIETEVNYFDDFFNLTSNTYTLTDDEERPIASADCITGGVQPRTVYNSYEKLAKAKGTKVFLKTTEAKTESK